MSHDFEDIINVVEGRSAIVAEIASCQPALRAWLAEQFAAILATPDFMNALPGLVAYDELHARRVSAVKDRILAIAGLEAG